MAATNGTPLAGLFAWTGTTPWFVEFASVAVPWGELFVGLGLLAGALVRLAPFFGALTMLLFYFGNWSVERGAINGDFAYVLVFLAVAAFGAGHILGPDALIESYDVGGRTLIESDPALEYVLGEAGTRSAASVRSAAPSLPLECFERVGIRRSDNTTAFGLAVERD